MKLVFIHGWALDPYLWDNVCALLPTYACERINLGFYGTPTPEITSPEDAVLIGHSLGFVEGLKQSQKWRGWIAINSFPRFVKTETAVGCTSASELRDIALRLRKDPQKTVQDFHCFLGAVPPEGMLNPQKLQAGLDTLRHTDVGDVAAQLFPGLVLASNNDLLVPSATSEALATHKDIIWHTTGGHILPQSDPVFCADAIRNFMENHAFNRT